jgi:hypothetical protein
MEHPEIECRRRELAEESISGQRLVFAGISYL